MQADARALVETASRGDGDSAVAIDQLLQRYLPGLRAFIRLRTGPALRAKESSSDLAQSVCREILQHLDRYQYRGEAEFKRWLYTTALRKIANRAEFYGARKRGAGREVALDPGTAASGAPDVELLAAYRSVATPSRHAVAREELEQVERAFERLSDEHREVIVLSRIVGLGHKEIAEHMARSELAVRSLLHRALAELAEQMSGDDSSER